VVGWVNPNGSPLLLRDIGTEEIYAEEIYALDGNDSAAEKAHLGIPIVVQSIGTRRLERLPLPSQGRVPRDFSKMRIQVILGALRYQDTTCK
jgi:hypothetical protein